MPRTGPLCFCTRETSGSPCTVHGWAAVPQYQYSLFIYFNLIFPLFLIATCICFAITAGFHRPMLPSTIPPARRPKGSVVEPGRPFSKVRALVREINKVKRERGYSSECVPAVMPLHASLWKRSLHLTEPLIVISFPEPKSTAMTSRSAVVSKESSMALATVPTASNPLSWFSGDHATVPERFTYCHNP